MSVINTLRVAKELQEGGFPRERAEALAEAMLEFRTHEEQEWIQNLVNAGYAPEQAAGILRAITVLREGSGNA